MSYQTGTTHYNLPQTVGTDKRDWFDTNQAFADVDSALYGVVQQNATDHSDIATMKDDISDLKAADTQFGLDLAETNGRVTTLEQHEGADAEAIQDLADMFCPLEEASAEADVRVDNRRMFRYNGVLYRATDDIAIGDTIVPNTNCRATNMEYELDTFTPTVEAGDVTYDNTSSGMTADDVQEAIDELHTSLSKKLTYSITPVANQYVTPYSHYYEEDITSALGTDKVKSIVITSPMQTPVNASIYTTNSETHIQFWAMTGDTLSVEVYIG